MASYQKYLYLILIAVVILTAFLIAKPVSAQITSSRQSVQPTTTQNQQLASLLPSLTSLLTKLLNPAANLPSNNPPATNSISSIAHAQTAPNWTQKGGTLSADVQGWASHPAITTASDGTIYAAWSQHLNPNIADLSGTYVSRFLNGAWQQLGGRIGNVSGVNGANNPEGYNPSIAVLGTTPYVAWYEGGGYGWGMNGEGAAIFVAHWNGTTWVTDSNTALTNGALNTAINISARNPRLAVINNVVYAAWIEARGIPNSSAWQHVVVVKHLSSGTWVRDGSDIFTTASDGTATLQIYDVAITGAGGVPYVAWTECNGSTACGLYTSKFSAGAWTAVGGSLNISAGGFTNYLSITSLSITPYVAWQEKPLSGNYQIYVKHWDGTSWIQDGGSLNVNPSSGEAGPPSIKSDAATTIWLAYAESPPGQIPQLYVRSLTGGTWSAAEGGLNLNPISGVADAPALAISSGVPQVIWAEKHAASYTKQVYVKGRDASGVAIPVNVTRFGGNGPAVTLAPNTWTSMNPGGIAAGMGVGDEGYSTFSEPIFQPNHYNASPLCRRPY